MDGIQDNIVFLPLDDLVNRHVYLVEARSFIWGTHEGEQVNFGIWNADKLVFSGLHYEWGRIILSEETEYSTDDHYGTARGITDINIVLPDDIEIDIYKLAIDEKGKQVYNTNEKLRDFLLTLNG